MNIYRNVRYLNSCQFRDRILFPCPPQPGDTGGSTECSRPLMVVCETVNICSNSCIICPYGTMTRKKEVMPLELFEKLLKDYSAMGGGQLSLTPRAGEIFLDPLLTSRLDLIGNYKKITGISVTTNAVESGRFPDTELRRILSSFSRFRISVYGLDPGEYATMTRRNTYPRMVENINRIIGLSPRPGSITLAFRLLREPKRKEIDAWINENLSAKPPYNFSKAFMDWGGSLDATKPLPLSGTWRHARANATQCGLALLACMVFSNGDVSFCPCNDYDIKEEFRLGNIAEASLAAIINSQKNAKLWDSPLYLPRSCAFCSSHRPVQALGWYYPEFFDNPARVIDG